MSLINEMLENLDERQPNARRSQSAMLEGLASGPSGADSGPARGGPSALTYVSIVLLVLLIGLVLLDDHGAEPERPPLSPLPQYAMGPQIPPPSFAEADAEDATAAAYGAPPEVPRGYPAAHGRGEGAPRQAPAEPETSADRPDPIDLPAAPPEGAPEEEAAASADAGREVVFESPTEQEVSQEQPFAPPQPGATSDDDAPASLNRPHPDLGEEPDIVETARGLLGIQERAPTARQLAEESYRFGLGLAGADQNEAAMRAFRDALALDPRHGSARAALARLLIESGDVAAARAALRQGMELDPAYAEFKILDAHAALLTGDTLAAVRILSRMPVPVEGNIEYHATLAAAYQRIQDHPRALDQYRRLIALDRQNPSWWLGLAISLEAGGQRGHALEAYRSANAIGTLEPEARRFVAGRVASLERTGP